jgi:hypothetical protein
MSGSDAANALLLDGTGSLSFTTTASYNAFSASYAIASASLSSRTTQVEQTYASTGSNTFTGAQYVSDTSNGIGFTSTASFYTDGGLRVGKNAYVSGTAYFNNIVVFGTSSIQYITSSQVNIGANIITVNTDTPAVRFGGLSVFDSGSTQLTGSMLWDSEKNHWVYSNPSGSTYSGGMFISGPRSSVLGSEQGTTSCMLLVGQGGDHLTSSLIYHDSTRTCIPNILNVGGVLSGSSAMFSGSYGSSIGLYLSGNTYGMYGANRGVSSASAGMSYYSTGSQKWFTGIYENTDNFGFYNATTATFPMVITSGNNVGINTTNFGEKLNIGCGGAAAFQNTCNCQKWHIQYNSNDGLNFVESAVADFRLFLKAGGNVGIGTPVPGRKLDVCGVTRANAYDVYYNCATSGYLLTETQWTGVAGVNNVSLAAEGGISCGGNITFFTNGSTTERMRITTGGRLGIADSNPNMLVSLGTSTGRKLHMYNDGGASDIGGGLGVDLGGFSAETSIFYGCYGGAGRFSIGSWSTANCYSTKLTVNANGELLLNTTVGTSADPVHRFGTNGGTTYARIMIQERTGVWLSLNTGATNIGTVYQNGSVVVYGGTSDYRLKENIKPMTKGLERVMKLNPVEYTWKRDCSYGEGFIAHELQEVVPIAVTGTKDGLNEVGDPDWQNVDKSHIVPILVKAIQEQQCKIALLESCLGIA